MPSEVTARHQCLIYEGAPSRMLPALVTALRQQLAAGMRCLYLNSPVMVAGVRSQLYAAGVDVERELARGSLRLVDDQDHLVDGRFDIERMIDSLDAAVAAALADGFAGLYATGDMTWEFGPERDFARLLEYELALEQLFHRRPALHGMCQYHRELLPPDAARVGLVSHAVLAINATLARLNPHYVAAADRHAAVTPALDATLDALLARDG